MARLYLYALGPPRIQCNDQPIELARRKALALLVYLAVTGQSHSRDALAALFWPEYSQSRARAGLRRALAALKKALADEVRTRTGVLLKHPGVYEQLTAEDNLEFYGRAWRMPVAERQARIKELLTRIGLWERRKERVGTWSKGMKQKLTLARAMLHRPPLVFLDEPTAGLDVMAAAVRDDLEALAASEGVTVFLTTHNIRLALLNKRLSSMK